MACETSFGASLARGVNSQSQAPVLAALSLVCIDHHDRTMPVNTRPSAHVEEVRVFGGLSTRSAKMRATLASLERLAATELNFLIEGETGVGKELAAESVHRGSSRNGRPFVVFDCAAQSLHAGERELFGCDEEEPGMVGSLELAEGGTVLLDHIDELALPLQVKLLRALERREIRRVGGQRNIALDVRVIGAGTRALGREVRLGTFKRELYAEVCAECAHSGASSAPRRSDAARGGAVGAISTSA